MNITHAFIVRLTKMPERERNDFLEAHREVIDFTLLSAKVKDLASQAIEKDEHVMADKLLDIKADICMYQAIQRFPSAVQEYTLEDNPTPEKNKVRMEMSSVQ